MGRFANFYDKFWFMDLMSMDSKTLVTLALLDAFGAEQSLLTYLPDFSGPAQLGGTVVMGRIVGRVGWVGLSSCAMCNSYVTLVSRSWLALA